MFAHDACSSRPDEAEVSRYGDDRRNELLCRETGREVSSLRETLGGKAETGYFVVFLECSREDAQLFLSVLLGVVESVVHEECLSSRRTGFAASRDENEKMTAIRG